MIIEVKSVVKVTQGGRQRRFSATVVVGDKKGTVGIGIGKANEVPEAISKALFLADPDPPFFLSTTIIDWEYFF